MYLKNGDFVPSFNGLERFKKNLKKKPFYKKDSLAQKWLMKTRISDILNIGTIHMST